MPPRRLGSLGDKLPDGVPDPRAANGRWHPWRAVLALTALAKLCGVPMGQRQIAEFARGLTKPQRRALGCRRADAAHPDRTGYAVPAESTFQRAMAALDHHRFDPLVLAWQHAQLGPVEDDLIAMDGKALRRSGGLALASAVGQQAQRGRVAKFSSDAFHAFLCCLIHDSAAEISASRRSVAFRLDATARSSASSLSGLEN